MRGAGRVGGPPGRVVEARPPPVPEVRVWQAIPEPLELHGEPGIPRHPRIPPPDPGPRQEVPPFPGFNFGPRGNVPWPDAELGQGLNMPDVPLWLYGQENAVQLDDGADVDAMLGM